MTQFIDGPAAGETLFLKRAPEFLRAVRNARGEWDALDQLGDTPASDETIVVYQLDGPTGWCHINRGRHGSGMFVTAQYRVLDPQPADDEVRSTTAWRTWAQDRFDARA